MRIFVTNLKTSPDRRAHIINEFKGKGLEFTFVDCVVGKDLTDEELDQKCDMPKINHYNRNGEWFTKGVIGCALTNQNTYRTLIESKADMAFLLEDDTKLPHNLKEILEDIERKAIQGDIILLFYFTYSTLKLKLADKNEKDAAVFYTPVNPECLLGGSAVVVTRKAAEKMLAFNTPIKIPPDSWNPFREAGCIDRIICLYPPPVITAEFETTMEYVKDGALKKLMNSNPFTRFILKMKRKLYRISKQRIEIVD
jgi:glycosyl transferase family 25